MKVLTGNPLIVQVMGYYPPCLGGAEKVTQMLAEHLAARGHDVLVLTSNIGQPADATETHPGWPHLRVKRLKAFEFAHTPIMPGILRELVRLPRDTIVHLHLAEAYYPELVLLVSRLRRIPYILHFHLDLQPSGFFGRLFLIYKAVIIRSIIKHAERVVVLSVEQQKFVHRKYGIPTTKITIIPNGVGQEYFIPQRKSATSKPYNLLSVGRLAYQKRLNILIEALSHMKMPVRLTIIGDGEDRAKLESLAQKFKLTNTQFAGRKTPEQVIDYYTQADVFVTSSENEGMSLAVLEAMAAGLPIVAAKVPGLTDVLQDVGVLVDRPSGQTFARALDKLLAKPDELTRLSAKSATAAQRYSWPKVIDAVEQLYRELEP